MISDVDVDVDVDVDADNGDELWTMMNSVYVDNALTGCHICNYCKLLCLFLSYKLLKEQKHSTPVQISKECQNRFWVSAKIFRVWNYRVP